MNDETRGTVAWWMGIIRTGLIWLSVALFVLFLAAIALGMHGWPF